MEIGQTFRNGGCRATYRPDWDAARPWILYVNGSAIARHAVDLPQAERILGVKLK
jgi:hypothetical protein